MDYSKVDPIHQKRTLAFLNHFLIRTTSFLNHFAAVCDEKLENLLVRIQRLEASMCILEAKLASIPGLDDVAAQSVQQSLPEKQANEESSPQPATTESIPSSEQTEIETELEKPKMTVSQDPRYSKYFKMINLGVPVGAVKQKMITEGVDPNILDDPSAETLSKPIVQEENDDSDVSSFSD